MEENDLETRFIREEIGRCEDLEELKARIFPLLQSQQELWMQKMQEILAESGLTKSAFAKRCRVQGSDTEEPRDISSNRHGGGV